ncbi:SIMPL domain-containing protein [Ammoniphilus sp. CFH 90114]|uniref:SIMPL domain-containing protein n=1 Tax=Ammoniphilus sp. CFH 90114 TaxID=2493665 RepID=UPI0013E90618|nr:SIMPL domain-containing protein [Ammoniphilus sp. CFH 90114]
MKDSRRIWRKSITVPVVLALMVGAGFAISSALQPVSVSAISESRINTITVAGKGEITITPDVAYVQFGLNTEGKTAQEAQQKNAQLFSQIQDAIQKQGVDKADIKTVRYYTQPDYRWEKEQNVLKGYRTEHIVEVTYRKMDDIGYFLDTVSNAGVNRVENIRFSTEKEDEYQIEALEQAIDHAKKKAEALAARSGKKIKDVIIIEELGTSTPPIVYREANLMKSEAAVQDSSTVINQGELKMITQVQVTYEF